MTRDIAGIYARLELAWKVKGREALALKLGKSKSTLAGSKFTKRVPEEYLWHTVAETGCRMEWLLTGEEPKYKDDRRVGDLPEDVREVVRLMLDQPDTLRTLLSRAVRVLTSGQNAAKAMLERNIISTDEVLDVLVREARRRNRPIKESDETAVESNL